MHMAEINSQCNSVGAYGMYAAWKMPAAADSHSYETHCKPFRLFHSYGGASGPSRLLVTYMRHVHRAVKCAESLKMAILFIRYRKRGNGNIKKC